MSSKFDHPMPDDLQSIKDILDNYNYDCFAIYMRYNEFIIKTNMKSGNVIVIRKEKDGLFLDNKNISGHSISEFLDELERLNKKLAN
jgi:hypothetical protein